MPRNPPSQGAPPLARRRIYAPTGQRPRDTDLSDDLPQGWWLLPMAGLGLCIWTSLALVLT